METIKLTSAHDLPDGTYRAVWSGDTIFIERPEVNLRTETSVRDRRDGRVIIAGPDRTTVQFSDDSDETLDPDPSDLPGDVGGEGG